MIVKEFLKQVVRIWYESLDDKELTFNIFQVFINIISKTFLHQLSTDDLQKLIEYRLNNDIEKEISLTNQAVKSLVTELSMNVFEK